jgi:hypothetical protein
MGDGRWAMAAASTRLATPSLVRIRETWTPAVPSVMNSSRPICWLVRPLATQGLGKVPDCLSCPREAALIRVYVPPAVSRVIVPASGSATAARGPWMLSGVTLDYTPEEVELEREQPLFWANPP